jgi:pimeloyl-ACP methyl ester carboxylesterase
MRLGLSDVVTSDGYELATMTCGNDKMTVIIEPGLNVRKESYYGLQRRIFSHATVVTYDHAGIGESTVSNNPRTLPFYVQELKDMLADMELEPPYILIGHSLGGHVIRYFTYLYPDEVAGIVFLDHPHEDWFRYIRENWSPDEQVEYFKWWNPEVTSQDQVGLIERLEYDNNNDLIRGKVLPDNIPVLMFTGDNHNHFRDDPVKKAADMQAWAMLQFSLIYHVGGVKHVIDWETGHAPHRDKPDDVAREINAFIDKVKQTM